MPKAVAVSPIAAILLLSESKPGDFNGLILIS